MSPSANRPPRGRFSLTVLGAHTHLHSSLCVTCPYEAAGCCTSPPPYDWADVGRVLALASTGRAHLTRALSEGKLLATSTGLAIVRTKRKFSPTEPRTARCVFLGPEGCTISPHEKPAVCNYYVCEAAQGGPPDENPLGAVPFTAYAALRELWTRWALETNRVVEEAYSGDVPPFDDRLALLLVTTYQRLEHEAGLASEPRAPSPEE